MSTVLIAYRVDSVPVCSSLAEVPQHGILRSLEGQWSEWPQVEMGTQLGDVAGMGSSEPTQAPLERASPSRVPQGEGLSGF